LRDLRAVVGSVVDVEKLGWRPYCTKRTSQRLYLMSASGLLDRTPMPRWSVRILRSEFLKPARGVLRLTGAMR